MDLEIKPQWVLS